MRWQSEWLKSSDKRRDKWARAAGDHETLSAKSSAGAGRYLQDLDCEMSGSIRLKPSGPGDKRLNSVKPSCCARRDELPKLTGQVQLNTGRMEVGRDERTHDMVFSFVRHELDGQSREVLENKAGVCTLHDKDRFRSNDRKFTEGAMEMRCEAARSPQIVMRQFGRMSARQGGSTTMDRVLPFQRTARERNKTRQLQELEHRNTGDRSNIHTAASGAAVLAAKKAQKQAEFRKKAAKAIQQAKQSVQTDDYQLYLRKKWERMRLAAALDSSAEEQTQQQKRSTGTAENKETERS